MVLEKPNGYLKIKNLYKAQDIFLTRECYAMEKIHGTSCHVKYWLQDGKPMITFFSGGITHNLFVSTFDKSVLLEKFAEIYIGQEIVVYGEGYGGSCQKMSDVYGKDTKFVVFDVKIGDCK